MKDIEDSDLKLEDIKNMSKGIFRKLIKQNMKNRVFGSLLIRKEARNSEHTKVKCLIYTDLKMAGYFPLQMYIFP